MLKAQKLRETITAHQPYLSQQPDRLNVFIDKGRVIGLGQKNYSFDYEYDAIAVITSFTGNIDQLTLPVFIFMCEHMPDVMSNHDKAKQAIKFEAEIINGDTVDLAITVTLRETVRVVRNPDGSYSAEHLPALTRVDDEVRDWLNFQGQGHKEGTLDTGYQTTTPDHIPIP